MNGNNYLLDTNILLYALKGLADVKYCQVIPIANSIKRKTIELKRMIKLAVPDALIAATAIEGGFTLVTADKGFKRIKDLSLILIEV